MRTRLLALSTTVLLSLACASCWKTYVDADVPALQKLDDVMWAQAQATDPQFKKIGKDAYTDEDWAAFTAMAKRLQLTTAKVKESYSKGPEFNQFADTLATHAAEIIDASTAKDSAKVKVALKASKDTCKACHSKFK